MSGTLGVLSDDSAVTASHTYLFIHADIYSAVSYYSVSNR